MERKDAWGCRYLLSRLERAGRSGVYVLPNRPVRRFITRACVPRRWTGCMSSAPRPVRKEQEQPPFVLAVVMAEYTKHCLRFRTLIVCSAA
jgi:hypothetical protein